jgi:starch synthase
VDIYKGVLITKTNVVMPTGNGITVYLLQCDSVFQHFDPNSAETAVFFSRAVCEFCLDQSYDVIHCNDWNTAIIPFLLKTKDSYRNHVRVKTLYTAHNAELGFQGPGTPVRPEYVYHLCGIDPARIIWDPLDPLSVVHDDFLNFFKTGINYADWINTVSDGYNKEMAAGICGGGLGGAWGHRVGILAAAAPKLPAGILNGIDTTEWDPVKKDKYLKHLGLNFSSADINNGRIPQKIKLRNPAKIKQFWQANPNPSEAWREAIEKSYRFTQNQDEPIIGMVTRIDFQKMEILLEALPGILALKEQFQFVLMGTSGKDAAGLAYTGRIVALEKAYPGRFLFFNIYDEAFSHIIYALSDIWLVPSVYEPCGLTQMYAMNYGTVPVVRRVGGLGETVTNGVNGFTFLEDPELAHPFRNNSAGITNAANLLCGKIQDALAQYQNPKVWEKLMKTGMDTDFSWTDPAKKYLDLYR